MDEDEVEAVLALVNPLLRALEMLTFVSRHLHPPDFEGLMSSIGTPDEDLKSARAKQSQWPEHLSGIRAAMDGASDAALLAFAGLREALRQPGDMRGAYRALRQLPKGLEALYPLAGVLPPVNRFFLDPSLRMDDAFQQLFLHGAGHDNTGVMQFGEGERGGFWLYVPENYVPDRAWPLVMALHGGSGTGRLFLRAGCAMRAVAVPSWWRRPRLGALGLRWGLTRTPPTSRVSSSSSVRGGTWMPRVSSSRG